MRYQTIILVLILGLAVTFGLYYQNAPSTDGGRQLVEFNPDLPNQPQAITSIQGKLDQVGQAAAAGRWSSAASYVENLEDMWQNLKPSTSQDLPLVQQIDAQIQTLHFNVWGRDTQGVIRTSEKLTAKLGEIRL